MKYIRTEDGIWQLDAFDCISVQKSYLEILKQADTIEELCDEFVVEDRDEFAIFHNLKLAKQTKGTLYGAIWTDKGLIYVAKMNGKGELELL